MLFNGLSWHRRSVSKVHDAWFADEDGVRKEVGLLERPVVEHPNFREVCCLNCLNCFQAQFPLTFTDYGPLTLQLTCGICSESYPRDKNYVSCLWSSFLQYMLGRFCLISRSLSSRSLGCYMQCLHNLHYL